MNLYSETSTSTVIISRDSSNSNSSSHSSRSHSSTSTSQRGVSFSTVTLREYERKLNVQADVDLGLTIGWKFFQHSPMDVDSFTRNEDEYREAKLTSEGERAELLLESGYSKRRLRSAMRRRHRQMDGGNDDYDDTDSNHKEPSIRIPQVIWSSPSILCHKIFKKGATRLPVFSIASR